MCIEKARRTKVIEPEQEMAAKLPNIHALGPDLRVEPAAAKAVRAGRATATVKVKEADRASFKPGP